MLKITYKHKINKMKLKIRRIPENFNFNTQPKEGLTVNLPKEVVLKEIPATQIKATQIKIARIVDESANKKVIAFTDKLGKIVLWEGAAYDAIGQWTDLDVQARILELYNN